jgi:hypothetical protein
VLADTNELQTDDVPGLIAALNDPTAATMADAVWDELLSGAAHNTPTSAGRRLRFLQEAGTYAGSIWIDTINGVAGTTDFENGTDSNPVDSIADANTLAASLGISRFNIAPGSTITLAAAQNNQTFSGNGWTLALGGQDIAGSTFIGAAVSGIASGTGTHQDFIDCHMGAISHIKDTTMKQCGIEGTQTVAEAGDYFLDRCYSAIAGTATWVFEFGDAIGNTNLSVRNYSGGIQLESMGDTGTDTASIEGQGQVIEGTCTGGTVAIRGNFTTSGITNLTLSDDARIDVAQINTEADTALTDYDPPTKAELDSGLAALNDPTAAAIRTEMDSNSTQLAAIVADTNELQTDDVPGLIAALNDISAADVNAQVDAAFTTQMADSVSTDGAIATREQALYMILQFLTDFAINSTTLTVKKVDGSSSLMTFTLDDGTNPTSLTRAT